jgi:hypothetical protein
MPLEKNRLWHMCARAEPDGDGSACEGQKATTAGPGRSSEPEVEWKGHVGRWPEASHLITGAREIVGTSASRSLAVASGPVACGSEARPCVIVVHRPPSLPACRGTQR